MKAVIDRFEGDCAVIILKDNQVSFDIPKKLIPNGCRPGSFIDIDIKCDKKGTVVERDRLAALLEKIKKENQ